jgi:hypothetical protein
VIFIDRGLYGMVWYYQHLRMCYSMVFLPQGGRASRGRQNSTGLISVVQLITSLSQPNATALRTAGLVCSGSLRWSGGGLFFRLVLGIELPLVVPELLTLLRRYHKANELTKDFRITAYHTSPVKDPSNLALCSALSLLNHKECTSPSSGHGRAFASFKLTGGPAFNNLRCSALHVVLAKAEVYRSH